MRSSTDKNLTLDSPFTNDKVIRGTAQLKTNKASCQDSIENEMIKASLDSRLSFLVNLYSKILVTQNYPEKWSNGIITPILKSWEVGNQDYYHGITINSCLSKLFDLLLNNRLEQFVNGQKTLKYNQIGFRKGFRTADHVLTLKISMAKYFSRNKKLYFCFVDFKKAYDSIWRRSLVYKIITSWNFFSLLHSMYRRTELS